MTERRDFLKTAAVGAVALSTLGIARESSAASRIPTPVTKWEAKKYTPDTFGKWPSDVDQHIGLYEGYVKKANEIWDLLQKVDRDPAKQNTTYSELRELKVEYSFAIGGIKNHEVFFDHLLPAAKDNNKPQGKLAEAINTNFGSFENFEADLRATAISARGWVWLAFDLEKNTLFNYIGDSQNSFPIWNSVPVLALDMFEHAFFKDYGRNRGNYISDFLKRVNWGQVQKNFDKAVSMIG